MPYEDVDALPICNVISDDILASIEDYCWQHPITKNMILMREVRDAVALLHSAGIDYHTILPLELYEAITSVFEQIAIELHIAYPQMSPHNIQLLAAIKLCHNMYAESNDANNEKIRHCINALFDPKFDAETRNMLMTDSGRHELADNIEQIMQFENGLQLIGMIMRAIKAAKNPVSAPEPKASPAPQPLLTYAAQKAKDKATQLASNNDRLERIRRQVATDQQKFEKIWKEKEEIQG